MSRTLEHSTSSNGSGSNSRRRRGSSSPFEGDRLILVVHLRYHSDDKRVIFLKDFI